MHCSKTLSKASRILPVLSQDNYSNPLIFPYATTLRKTSIVEVFSISDMQFSAYSTITTNPYILVLVICLMAFFIGPYLYISLYTIPYIIDYIIQYSSPNRQLPFELGLETLIGCPDELCYLAMFRKDCYDKVIQHIGHFPSIYALSTVPNYYRKQLAKGNFKLIGDNLAHYESQLYGDPAWEIVEKLTLALHLIGSKDLVRVSTKPP